MSLPILSEEIVELLPRIVVNLRLPALLSRNEQELTSIQLVALLAVDSVSEEGTPMGHLADRLGISRPATTALVDRLVDRQLIDRSHDPNDRRIVRLRLSAGGAAAKDRLLFALGKAVARALEGLPGATQRDVLMAVRHVSEFSQRMRTTATAPAN